MKTCLKKHRVLYSALTSASQNMSVFFEFLVEMLKSASQKMSASQNHKKIWISLVADGDFFKMDLARCRCGKNGSRSVQMRKNGSKNEPRRIKMSRNQLKEFKIPGN